MRQIKHAAVAIAQIYVDLIIHCVLQACTSLESKTFVTPSDITVRCIRRCRGVFYVH